MDNQTLLNELREAAEEKNGGKCVRITRILFEKLEPRHVLEIAFEQMESFLVTFEKRQPNNQQPRNWLNSVQTFQPIVYTEFNGGMYEDLPDDIDRASAAYIYAWQLIDSAFRAYFVNHTSVVVDLCASGIDSIAGAKVIDRYMNIVPAEWEFLMALEEIDLLQYDEEQKARYFQARDKVQPEREFIIQTFSLEVADQIETRLNVEM